MIDHLQLKEVHKVVFSCGKYYIGEIGRSFKFILKEHGANINNETMRSSSLLEHSSKTKHHVGLESIEILTKEGHDYKRRYKEGLEIMKHPNNLNTNDGI